MKKSLLTLAAIIAGAISSFAQETLPYNETFDRTIDGASGVYSWSYQCGDIASAPAISSVASSQYTFKYGEAIGGTGQYADCYGFQIVVPDATTASYVTLAAGNTWRVTWSMKSDVAFTLVMALNDGTYSTDKNTKSVAIPASSTIADYSVDFIDDDFNTWDANVVSRNISAIQLSPNKDIAPAVQPTIVYDNIRISNAASTATKDASANIAASKVYPNPVSDMAKVELNLKSASSVKVTLSDLMGKEVMTIAEGSFSELTKEFSVASLNKGIYTVNYSINGQAAKAELLMVK